jgi:hypothetical protein
MTSIVTPNRPICSESMNEPAIGDPGTLGRRRTLGQPGVILSGRRKDSPAYPARRFGHPSSVTAARR